MKKKILLGIAICLTAGILVYSYTYKAHRDISNETADYVVTIDGLEKEFTVNDSLAYNKYQNKTVELTATISAVDMANKGIVLGKKVFATFKSNLPKNLEAGKTVKIKARFLGYDELLGEFKIDQSSVVR